jgi:hypothetical protein
MCGGVGFAASSAGILRPVCAGGINASMSTLGKGQPGVQSGERGLQAGMDQRRSFYDDDVKSLFGISVQKLAIVPTPWSRRRPQTQDDVKRAKERPPCGEPSTRGAIKDCYFE